VLLAVVATASLALTACSRPDAALVRPGDSLLDLGSLLTVESYPPSVLPADLVDDLSSSEAVWSAAAEDWAPLTPDQTNERLRPLLIHLTDAFREGLGDSPRLWILPREFPEWTRLGRRRVRHEGRSAPSLRDVAFPIGGEPGRAPWLDGEGRTVFVWDAEANRILALREDRPGPLEVELETGASSALAFFERRLLGGDGSPTDADELAGRLELGGTTRTAIPAPAGTRLALEASRLSPAVASLAVAVGVWDLTDDGGVEGPRSGLAPSDGVTFTVEHVVGGVTETLWSRTARPTDGWQEDLVTLPPGRTGRIVLSSGPGPDGDPLLDHGAWADLRAIPAEPLPPSRPHVILIDVDTLRADRLGCYGRDLPTSPRIDAWARSSGQVFREASSNGNWTLPTTLSMLTGLDVPQHGVAEVTRTLAPHLLTLAERLSEAGYDTWARTDGGYLVPAFRFDRGFDLFDVHRPDEAERMATGWSAELERLATRRSGRPVFCFLQTYQVHTPFPSDRRFDDPEAPYDGKLSRPEFDQMLVQNLVVRDARIDARDQAWANAQYDAAVRRMDDVVGAFLEGLPEALDGEPVLVILTSDHGEEVLDRGWYGHRHSLKEELLHVPLIVQHPDGLPRPDVRSPASILDIVPTVLGYAGLEVPPALPGQSLASPLPRRRLLTAFHGDELVSVRFDGRKLIAPLAERVLPEAGQLFDLRNDPHELRDVSAGHPDDVERLLGMLSLTLAGIDLQGGPSEAPVYDQELLDDLTRLGYMER
jgi:arylsulfatase A-like enzyme